VLLVGNALSYCYDFFFFFYGAVCHRHLHSFPTRRSSDLAVDPALFQTIDAARLTGGENRDVVLELGRHRVLLTSDAGPEVIQSVVLVARDLAAKARPYAELDARYAGQIVVRRHAAKRAGSARGA